MQTHEMTRCCPPETGTADSLRPHHSMDSYAEWKSWQSEDFGQPAAAACAYFDLLWRRFIDRKFTSPSVLEIGFGNGQFLGWCRQRGMTVRGVETNHALLTRAKDAGFDCAATPDALNERRFDLIALFDVLEHIPAAEITPFLCRLSERLTPEGRIILRTPNGGSPLGLNHQHGDPTHAAILTAHKLRYLCAPAGLSIIYCGADLYPLFAGSLRAMPARVLRRALHQLLERIVRFVFSPQPRGVLSANLLTVMRRDDMGF